ncbi:MAG: hypothetical protein KDD58_01705 [Bdellovibrionales bacterium]|nr:hypothetical protein [Bdellovibrionales bacterium]
MKTLIMVLLIGSVLGSNSAFAAKPSSQKKLIQKIKVANWEQKKWEQEFLKESRNVAPLLLSKNPSDKSRRKSITLANVN